MKLEINRQEIENKITLILNGEMNIDTISILNNKIAKLNFDNKINYYK